MLEDDASEVLGALVDGGVVGELLGRRVVVGEDVVGVELVVVHSS